MPREVSNVSYDYRDHVVLVTGAARGQGRAHALAFSRAGAAIVACDVAGPVEHVGYALADEQELDAVAAEIEALGGRCLPFVCDVRDDARVREVVAAALKELGQIDILISNAGVTGVSMLHEMSDEQWDAVVDTHVNGARNFARGVTPSMIERRHGKILMTGSVECFIGLPANSHYVTAKHAMLGLMRALAVELAPHNINVNMVCPGVIDTPMSSGMLALDPIWAAGLGALSGSWNLFDAGERLEPEEITHAMLWLASDAAARVTGVALAVDAGFLLT